MSVFCNVTKKSKSACWSSFFKILSRMHVKKTTFFKICKKKKSKKKKIHKQAIKQTRGVVIELMTKMIIKHVQTCSLEQTILISYNQ